MLGVWQARGPRRAGLDYHGEDAARKDEACTWCSATVAFDRASARQRQRHPEERTARGQRPERRLAGVGGGRRRQLGTQREVVARRITITRVREEPEAPACEQRGERHRGA